MEVLEDKSQSFDVICQHCGSRLRVQVGEIITNLGDYKKYKGLTPWGQVTEVRYLAKRISQCPCCLTKDAEILLEKEDENQKRLSKMEKDLKACEDFFKRLNAISQ